MATNPDRGEIWLVDLGMVAKIRPCLVLSVPADDDNDRVLTTLAPHTTSTRGSRFEVKTNVRFLKTDAFDAQNLVTIPTVKLIRLLGKFPNDQMQTVESTVKLWLGLDEKHVFYRKLTHREVGHSWVNKIGKGGQLYSIKTPDLGELIGYQRKKYGQWVDEVYQHTIPYQYRYR